MCWLSIGAHALVIDRSARVGCREERVMTQVIATNNNGPKPEPHVREVMMVRLPVIEDLGCW